MVLFFFFLFFFENNIKIDMRERGKETGYNFFFFLMNFYVRVSVVVDVSNFNSIRSGDLVVDNPIM